MVAVAGVGGWQGVSRAFTYPEGAPGRRYRFATLTHARATLESLLADPKRLLPGGWSWPQLLNHLAQSIEYSLVGYPENRPLIQRTVGPRIFKTFQSQGYMKHDVTASIPGAPDLNTPAHPKQAYQRLIDAIASFEQHKGPFAPHFAYGSLTAAEYEAAHTMHLANHLGEIAG